MPRRRVFPGSPGDSQPPDVEKAAVVERVFEAVRNTAMSWFDAAVVERAEDGLAVTFWSMTNIFGADPDTASDVS